MAAILWTDVLDIPGAVADGFGSTTSGWQTMVLAVVNTQLDPDMFDGESGPITKMARCMLACHYSAFGKQGASGATTSESEGGVATSYAVPPFNLSLLYMTGYGRALRSLMNSASGGATVL
jgi:hypothetical protein